MATEREQPYGAFNFLVDLGAGPDTVRAGFQEVSGLGMEITVSEYRNGNDRENAPRKVPGLFKVPDVTLKRGVIGSLDLWEWIVQTRDGDPEARRTVTIQLLDESRQVVAETWRLLRAFPIRYRGPLLSAKGGSDLAIEELVLAAESIELE